jgi:energy-converting hydrogenase A subunit M
VIGMDDDARLKLMQNRIIKSYAWQRDIIVPLSKEFDCTTDELEEVLFDLLDLDSLENLHGTFESAQDICLYQKFNADLRLCWFIDTLEIIPREEGKDLRYRLVQEVKNGKSYEDALKEGRLELFQLLKDEAKY